MADTTVQPSTDGAAALRTRLLAALNTRAGMRQAIFMAEILLPPVAKRRVQSHPPTRALSSSSMGGKRS